MYPLKLVLLSKIFLTFTFWSLPLIVIPFSWLMVIGFPNPCESIIFVRLYGAANFALGVGYILGYIDLDKGKDVNNVITVGTISNGLACILLMMFGIPGGWNNWGILAKIFMWASAISTGLITVGLLIFNPWNLDISK
jgi:hypothetical protein